MSQNPTSTYYLHHRKSPGLVLVSPCLNENNYHTWSRNMRCALLSNNKLKFVDGSIIKLVNGSPLFDAWEIYNVMVLSWTTKTLCPQIVENVVYIDDAKIMWEYLKERFFSVIILEFKIYCRKYIL